MSYIIIDPHKRAKELKRDGLVKDKNATDHAIIKVGHEIAKMKKYGESKERIERELGTEANKILYKSNPRWQK